jgi:hypothetical protein
MLRFKILASVIPVLAAAVFARSEIGSVSHPCIALGDTSVELTSLFWTAGVHVAFTDDPARATVRVQITEDADAADFAVDDDGLGQIRATADVDRLWHEIIADEADRPEK